MSETNARERNVEIVERPELPFQWFADGRRDWEEEVRDLYRKGLSTVSRHVNRRVAAR